MFGTETLFTGVSMRALGAGRTNGVHCSPFDISRLNWIYIIHVWIFFVIKTLSWAKYRHTKIINLAEAEWFQNFKIKNYGHTIIFKEENVLTISLWVGNLKVDLHQKYESEKNNKTRFEMPDESELYEVSAQKIDFFFKSCIWCKLPLN